MSKPSASVVLLCFTVIVGLLCGSVNAANCNTSVFEAPFTPRIVQNKEEADLKVVVPNITSLRQFVDCSDPANVSGFCIDVFEKAFSILPKNLSKKSISYTCFNFPSEDSTSGPTYDNMIENVSNGIYDAVVGDVTIGAQRLLKVDFTQKYMESGIVILTKVTRQEVSPWILFGSPFTVRMWFTVFGAFAFTGLVLWMVEHNIHPEFKQGPLARRIDKIFWFVIEALMLLKRESIKSPIGQLIMVAWLLFVLLLSSSYTAGLSSFLTTNILSSTTQSILSLKASGKQIGYRRGSIVLDYLTIRFQIPMAQTTPLRTAADFINNITAGAVVAIVDELPYANIMLSTLSSSSCDFQISGPPLTSQGFGFGFRKDLNVNWAAAFSIAILNLTESGCLQQLQDRANMNGPSKCSSSGSSQSTQVTFKSSLVLFIPLIATSSTCLIIHYVKRFWQRRQPLPHTERLVSVDPSIYEPKALRNTDQEVDPILFT